MDGYKVSYYRLLSPKNKPSITGDTERPIYKYGWNYNGIDNVGALGYQQDAANIYRIRE